MNERKRSGLFLWQPDKGALRASIAGVIVILLSTAMIPLPAGSLAGIFIRDILMIFIAGIVYPLSILKAEDRTESSGLTFRKIAAFLLINGILAFLLSLIFADGENILRGFDQAAGGGAERTGEILYIMLAGIFECIFFYAFIRTSIAKSFGVIPGIIAAAAFYSLHHAGFQAEFIKLFFVGLLYAIPVALSGSVFVIYPFFWGIGAVWDVLVQSEIVSNIAYPWPRALLLSTLFITAAVIARITRTPARIAEGGAITDDSGTSAEEYGKRMKDHLAAEYRRFGLRAEKELKLPVSARVLEIGSGPGWAGIELLKRRKDIELIAVDASADMTRAARKNAAKMHEENRVEYKEGVVEDLGMFADKTFDAVISRDSLHHWTDPVKAFKEIDRVLKKTGRVFITDSRRNLTIAEILIVKTVCKRIGAAMAVGWRNSIAASWTPEEMRNAFKSADIDRWRSTAHFFSLEIHKR